MNVSQWFMNAGTAMTSTCDGDKICRRGENEDKGQRSDGGYKPEDVN